MIVEDIRYQCANAERRDALIAAYTMAAKSLDAAPQCLSYELSRCEEEPGAATLHIVWTSTEEHLGGFRKGEHFRTFFASIGPFVKQSAKMRHDSSTAVARSK